MFLYFRNGKELPLSMLISIFYSYYTGSLEAYNYRRRMHFLFHEIFCHRSLVRYSDIYVWGMRICVKIRFTIDVTPCNLVEAHLRFEGK